MNSSQPHTADTLLDPSIRSERDRLREQLLQKTHECSQLNVQVLHLTQDIEELKQDKKYLRRDNDGLRKDNDRLRADLERSERKKLETSVMQTTTQHVAGPPTKPLSSRQRLRSPSLEIIEARAAKSLSISRVKIEDEEKRQQAVIPPAITERKPTASCLRPYVQISLQSSVTAKRRLDQNSGSTTTLHPPDLPSTKRQRLDEGCSRDQGVPRVVPQIKEEKRSSPTPSASQISRAATSSSLTLSTPSQEPSSRAPSSQIKDDERKPIIKFKEDALVLPPDIIRTYLNSVKPLDIVPAPDTLQVPRKFLRLAYGGSDQQLLQFIQADRNPSGKHKRRIVFPMLEMNPAMPMAPGEPGLMFASRHEILEMPAWTVFRRNLSGKEAVWQYLGEYESELVGKMTAEQFRDQGEKVRNRWAKLLLEQRAFDVYVSMRARIALRKAGCLPIDDKEEEDRLVAEEVLAVKTKKGRPVDEDDIVTAFSRGDEGIDIIRMKCVLYDHVFAQDIRAKFPDYQDMLADAARNKAATARTSSNGGGQRKKKRNEVGDLPRNKKGKDRQRSPSDSNLSGCAEPDVTHESSSPSRLRRLNRSQWDSASGSRVRVGPPVGSKPGYGLSENDDSSFS